ncbi:hypothetical protein Rs2_16874 [Raphanus sativus]|uniref:RING-type E3 ubiquitin transferase n=1 Tax=Raphanus sativus TaxID=3726 RepID=A0A6J0NAY7_RAPSA|nr:RING-H2 finger protein ATL67-like [Raphanus sativus]KAJ4902923.1 hypothetical protein Rs2_16874 [Raphanus sativus]
METRALNVEISSQVTPQGLSLGLLNSVFISQRREIQEFLVDESDDGNITSLGTYLDSSSFPDMLSLLRLKDFEPTTVHQQIKKRFNDPVLSRLVTDQIVLESQRKDLPQGPLLITVFLKFTKKEYFVAPFSSAPWTTAKVEGSCAICLEEMSEESEQALCQPPGCVHMFHEDCLTHWLDRHDSCPLCRQSTNPLTNEPSEALKKLGKGFE